MGTIAIESKLVPGIPEFADYQHLYLVLSNEVSEFVIRGGPFVNFPPYGPIVTQTNILLSESEDARGSATPAERGNRVITLGNLDVEGAWEIMRQQALIIQASQIDYELFSQNSNSVIASVLYTAGINIYDNIPNGHTVSDYVAIGNFLAVASNLAGTAKADVIAGAGNNDTIFGGAGNDTLYGDQNNLIDLPDMVDSETFIGNDSLNGGTGSDSIDGGNGNDTLIGGAGSDKLIGDGGNDTLVGGSSQSLITDTGTDTADYSASPAAIVVDMSKTSGQILDGYDGTDSIYSIEKIIGSAYEDTLVYADAIQVVDHVALVDGGAGRDTIDFSKSAQAVTYTINGFAGTTDTNRFENALGTAFADTLTGDGKANTIKGGSGNDTIDGSDGNDKLFGEGNNDSILGGRGNDTVAGGAGSDILSGGNDNDVLRGGAGNDALFGDAGFDTFEFTLAAGLNGQDTILDSDGMGAIKINGAILSGEAETVEGGGWTLGGYQFTQDGTDMLIANGSDTIRITDFAEGQTKLGIRVPEEEQGLKTFTYQSTIDASAVGGSTNSQLIITYTFDTSLAPGTGNATGNSLTFESYGPVSGTISIGGETTSFSSAGIYIVNDLPVVTHIGTFFTDSYALAFSMEGELFGYSLDNAQFVLVDRDIDMLTSLALPSNVGFVDFVDYQQFNLELLTDPDKEETISLQIYGWPDMSPEEATPFTLTA